jgi:hypothetical protein
MKRSIIFILSFAIGFGALYWFFNKNESKDSIIEAKINLDVVSQMSDSDTLTYIITIKRDSTFLIEQRVMDVDSSFVLFEGHEHKTDSIFNLCLAQHKLDINDTASYDIKLFYSSGKMEYFKLQDKAKFVQLIFR